MKKVIALSTARQLRFIIFILRMGYSELAFFHLISHGFFKALLFLCRGVSIHQMENSQDIRKPSLPTLMAIFLKRVIFLRRLALMGLPFLGAFFRKHKILLLLIFHNFN
jgi:NADH:ubiquinone oxidoreductase subunit 5 (subunit L)/multisubunit Na+/H+ antiporter MnhA subunit